MSSAIFEKPLSEVTWSDLEEIVTKELEEDQTLEFKEALPAKDGNIDPWQSGRDKIADHARDTLAEEVAAFANAYGGVVIVGIEETNDNPRRAKAFKTPLIRECIECVERLGPALKSRLDPPISGFDIRAFPKPDGNGEGLIVMRVASSTLAPHGVGRPPIAHVRRGSAKEPLTMRDLHNLFWESRTRRERVLQVRRERQGFMVELEHKKQAGRLIRFDGHPVPASDPHLMFRCTVVPEQSLGLSGIASKLINAPLARPEIPMKNGQTSAAAFGNGRLPRGWQPKAHAAQAEDVTGRMFSLWTIGDDGLVDVVGFSLSRDSKNEHYPGWFSLTVAQLLLMAEQLRLTAGRPDVPLIVDAQFRHIGTARALPGPGAWEVGLPDENVAIGPFAVTARAELPRVHRDIEREIWFGLGVPRVVPLEVDFETVFSNYLVVRTG
ncbi:ATP-binding protein [Methylocapsa polymorpha]|uniref:ATP-binding protein n=1 Tax=Methylocapsa polymorpha TaxID=3080828 RepID=A0ABZ0HWY7_9HYPH|nr:ATP-binding protein [Methylocapsa sp. RX1]